MSKREDRKVRNAEVYDYLFERANEKKERANYSKSEKLTLDTAKSVVFLDEFEKIITKTFKGKLPTGKTPSKSKGKVQRVVNLLLSDVHYGSNTDAREVKIAYGPVEEARRTARVCIEVANYKRQYRNETSLNLFLAGDMIDGCLHDEKAGAPVAEQCAAAMSILVQAVAYLAKEFPNGVNIHCATGNHGRRKERHHDRAVQQKFDSLETIIYTGIKLAFRDGKNVTVNIPYTPYIDCKVFNKRMFISHGDSVFKIGYPSSNINVKSIKDQVNAINAAEGRKNQEYDVFAFGHVHVGSMVHLPGGATLITNGALLNPDAFAESIGIFNSTAGQYLWESVQDHAVGDSRFIQVSEKDDKDRSLDAIIKPYTGL